MYWKQWKTLKIMILGMKYGIFIMKRRSQKKFQPCTTHKLVEWIEKKKIISKTKVTRSYDMLHLFHQNLKDIEQTMKNHKIHDYGSWKRGIFIMERGSQIFFEPCQTHKLVEWLEKKRLSPKIKSPFMHGHNCNKFKPTVSAKSNSNIFPNP